MFTSTRKKLNYNEFECIVKGLSDDGGLFICDNFNEYSFDQSFISKDYNSLALSILKFFFKNFEEKELINIINNAYNKSNFNDLVVGVKTINNNVSFLELFHGPTLAFKDIALTILPYLLRKGCDICGIKEEV